MYEYEKQKAFVYSDEGIKVIIEILNKFEDHSYLNTMQLMDVGDSWNYLACLDWLEKNKKIKLISDKYNDVRNDWVYKLIK